jgi:hypothetical protein
MLYEVTPTLTEQGIACSEILVRLDSWLSDSQDVWSRVSVALVTEPLHSYYQNYEAAN